MVNFSSQEHYEYVVKVEFMSVRKFELHRFCFYSDAVKCLNKFHDDRNVFSISLHSELVQARGFNPLFD